MLRFPNPSRNFDDSKKRVCFWGYDSAIEVSFFIDTVTLKQLCPEMIDAESGVLLTFDAQREQIHEMASKVYTRRSHGSYSHNLSIHDRRR